MPSAICPECHEEVYVDAESEQGTVVTCDECGAKLVVVGLDPIHRFLPGVFFTPRHGLVEERAEVIKRRQQLKIAD